MSLRTEAFLDSYPDEVRERKRGAREKDWRCSRETEVLYIVVATTLAGWSEDKEEEIGRK